MINYEERHAICMKRKLQVTNLLMFAGFVRATLLPRPSVTDAITGTPSDNQSPTIPEAVIHQLPEIQELQHTKIGLGR